MKESQIGFFLMKIETDQFAVIESSYIDNQPIELKIGINFGIDPVNKVVGCFTFFEFLIQKAPFITIKTKCEFGIESDKWTGMIDDSSNTITFPNGFMSHLATISVGTTRGILHAKTEHSKFNQFLLPTINVTDFVKGDISFLLEKVYS